MKIERDSYLECWVVTEEGVELGRFPSLHAAEEWVCREADRREVQA